jgi:hypothetical protein
MLIALTAEEEVAGLVLTIFIIPIVIFFLVVPIVVTYYSTKKFTYKQKIISFLSYFGLLAFLLLIVYLGLQNMISAWILLSLPLTYSISVAIIASLKEIRSKKQNAITV